MKQRVLLVFGTRPEAIKMAPVLNALLKMQSVFETKVCITAQHRQMLDQVLSFFNIVPDYDLNLMSQGQNLYWLTSEIIMRMKPILDEYNPDLVFVHGDTTTSMAASIAAFYSRAKICHVEAGLRTYNKLSPFPEEMNRCVTASIAEIHFAPTNTAKRNLLNEGISEDKIVVTGNTVIDALLYSNKKVSKLDYMDLEIAELANTVDLTKKTILVTGHRRENHGNGFKNICAALARIAARTDEVEIIFPVHLNPNIRDFAYEQLSGIPNIKLMAPLSYPAFVWLMSRCYLILTDSGGIQEEAPSLGKPVLVMRDSTERPEALEAGGVILVGNEADTIVRETLSLLWDDNKYQKMCGIQNPYGDGLAARRIVDYLANWIHEENLVAMN